MFDTQSNQFLHLLFIKNNIISDICVCNKFPMNAKYDQFFFLLFAKE